MTTFLTTAREREAVAGPRGRRRIAERRHHQIRLAASTDAATHGFKIKSPRPTADPTTLATYWQHWHSLLMAFELCLNCSTLGGPSRRGERGPSTLAHFHLPAADIIARVVPIESLPWRQAHGAVTAGCNLLRMCAGLLTVRRAEREIPSARARRALSKGRGFRQSGKWKEDPQIGERFGTLTPPRAGRRRFASPA